MLLSLRMEKKEDQFQNFKTALTSTVKSISNIEGVEVTFGNQTKDQNKLTIRLPEPENINNKINYTKSRALADSEALKIRFSNKSIFKKHEPKGMISKKLYNIAEKNRYEKRCSVKFKGIKQNIHNYYNERIKGIHLNKSENKLIE